ncbi:kinase domain-containing protein [Stipitochalara longipes BDJ]|nr:kinase domain-containing protein [Stipitochalara longipes BDJ]
MPLPDQNENTLDCGSYVDSDDEVNIEDEAEAIEQYFSEAPYFPVLIGQVLNQRYRIEHKLGHGGFSTVWMAYDMQTTTGVALKIAVAGAGGEKERWIQDEIRHSVQSPSRLVLYQHFFYVSSHRGNHLVLVLPVCGPSLNVRLRQASMAARMSAAWQLLQALGDIHSSGFVHRDLSTSNVMWGMASLDNLDTNQKYQHLGRPEKMKIIAPDGWAILHSGWRADLVKAVVVPESLIRGNVYLSDFGLAIRNGTSVDRKLQTPARFCAPERFHNVDPTPASDMWSFMCIFAQLVLGWSPFPGTGAPTVMGSIVGRLGPLPRHWKGSYNAGEGEDWWYDHQQPQGRREPLHQYIDRVRPGMGRVERDLVQSVLSIGFCYLPESRLSALQLLDNVSFRTLLSFYTS